MGGAGIADFSVEFNWKPSLQSCTGLVLQER